MLSDLWLKLRLFLNVFGSFPVPAGWGGPLAGSRRMGVMQMLLSVTWPGHITCLASVSPMHNGVVCPIV